ncbi:MAG: 30S ribosomal protein S4 [Nitrospirae bacterium]|nr:30S ribosomal protein S4 [Nitrospirota bacterium]
MARYTDALCRICRREGEKLFLKGNRCFTDKCAIERRKYPPGQHGQRRGKLSDYGVQLRTKQLVRASYGMLERQFRRYFRDAEKQKGATGEVLLQFLERRLDNVVYRLGFASNRRQARQLIGHRFFSVNGKAVNIPSYLVSEGDVIEVREKARQMQLLADNLASAQQRGLPEWLELEIDNMRGRIRHIPSRDEIQLPVQEQLIVELYSK